MEELPPRAQAKRDQIFEAARRLFLELGFGRTSMEAIRGEAGVSKPTLYSYYSGKEELFDAVLRHLIEGPEDWLPEVDTLRLESREDLRRVLSGVATGVIEAGMRPDNVALTRVIIAETPVFPQLGDLFRSSTARRNLRFMSALLERARRQGLVGEYDTEAVWRMFVGPLLTYVLFEGLFEGSGPPRKPARERIDGIVDLCMRAISGSDAPEKDEGREG